MSARPGDLPDWTIYRSKYGTSKTRRVHIKAPSDASPRSSVRGSTAFCGTLSFTFAERESVDPARMPKDMVWCGKCLGLAAEYLSLSPKVGELVQHAIKSRCDGSMPTAKALLDVG
jgi:hypothetical protein